MRILVADENGRCSVSDRATWSEMALVSTGYGECNTPHGHDSVYEIFMQVDRGRFMGFYDGLKYSHESPLKIVFLDLHGPEPIRIDWFDITKELKWNETEMKWERRGK